MSFHLPGNPFDPRDACTDNSKTYRDSTDDYISGEGATDATLIYLGISELTHAVMAHAYEQRTANLLAAYTSTAEEARELLRVHPPTATAWMARDQAAEIWNEIAPRLGLTTDKGEETA